MNPKHLALDTIVKIVDHEPPTHEGNEVRDEIVMDATINVDIFEIRIGDDGKVRYRRSENSITEEFDPVMMISETITRATPMAISIASDSAMRLLSRVGGDHSEFLGDKEEGVDISGTNNVHLNSHGTPLPLSVFGRNKDDANYWAIRYINVKDNVTITSGHAIEVVSEKYCFDDNVNK